MSRFPRLSEEEEDLVDLLLLVVDFDLEVAEAALLADCCLEESQYSVAFIFLNRRIPTD